MPTETDLVRAFKKEVHGNFVKITPGPWGNSGEPDLIGAIEARAVAMEAKKASIEMDGDFLVITSERPLTPIQAAALRRWSQYPPFMACVLLMGNFNGRRHYFIYQCPPDVQEGRVQLTLAPQTWDKLKHAGPVFWI